MIQNRDATTKLLPLYPLVSPYSSGFLAVDETHNLYWEQSGNPDGIPVVVLHGGPGAGASPMHRRFFDPDHYRIVIFDQRGAGRSHPLGSFKDNTLPHLIGDIELLREHLSINRWHVFGGSWGSTLALAYAQAHPSACISLILRGIFLLEQVEVDWFMKGMRTIFPESWEQFVTPIPGNERSNLLEAYYKRLSGNNEEDAMNAAVCWTQYESACSSLLPSIETITTKEQKDHAYAQARIEAHYFREHVIAEQDSLMNGIPAIRHIPATIVQGRYDIVCPIQTAHRLHQAWPEADYVIVPDGGHSAMDPPIRSRLIEAMEHVKNLR